MSEQSIYNALRNGGLSHAGACAMMGNMYCESLLDSKIVETRCSMSGSDYTWNVDHGGISEHSFVHDAYGFGLCQWTYFTRKQELYQYAKSKGVSIGDEQMQCQFCINELKKYYSGLYNYLCKTDDLPTATRRICAEYERPAINNFADRINKATDYGSRLSYNGEPAECNNDSCPIEFDENVETTEITVRVLKKGMLGRDVYMLQCGINDAGVNCGEPDGDFGPKTETALREYQEFCNLDVTGVADTATWQTLFQ